MIEFKHSFCRICINQCAIIVTVDDGKVVAVNGDPKNPQYKGYTCVKGRAQPLYLSDQTRLLRPLRRSREGLHEEIDSNTALTEVAEKLKAILAKFGPRSIAAYSGTMAVVGCATTGVPLYNGFLDAIGTNMRFDPQTIDKGGKQAAQSFLGYWEAPSQGFDNPEVIMLIGINPWVTRTGFPAGSPKVWLTETLARGCKLIVIDPRETQTAQKADYFLRVSPGNDIPVLASMIKLIIEEGLYDHDFVAEHAQGLDELLETVRAVDITAVAAAAQIDKTLLIDAARCYARGRRGYTMAGTGPHMNGTGTLLEYLILVIETLCGHWLRAGEKIKATPILSPVYRARAQARSPDDTWVLDGTVRIRGLKKSRAGMPTAALAEEILMPGEGQVRALISWGGNPAAVIPDQGRTVEALKSLELFVQIDPWYSESARLADYVLPPTMPLEAAASTILETISGKYATGYGQGLAHAQYTPAITDRPVGSDILEDWEIFYELMARMGYPVEVRAFGRNEQTPKIHLESRPKTDDLLEMLNTGSRVPLAEVKKYPGGRIYDDDLIEVEPADTGHSGRLNIGNVEMLQRLRDALMTPRNTATGRNEFRLLCRRMNHVYNTSCNNEMTNVGRAYNPAFLHPDDMRELGALEGAQIFISSSIGRISAIAHADTHLKRGVVSMSFGFGVADNPSANPAEFGSNPNRLISVDEVFDPYTGQPRMTNVPVTIYISDEMV